MVDYNDILNALDNLNSYKKRATMNINKPGITSSVPNYKTEQMLGNIGKAGRTAGLATTAIPFYKDFAFPVANDLYQGFIMGNPDKSNVLKAALNLAGIDRYGNKVESQNTTKDIGVESQNTTKDTGVPLPKTSGAVAGQQDVSSTQQQPLEGIVTSDGNEKIESILRMAKDRNAPYIRALEQYLANYPKLLDQSARNNLYFYGANLAKGLDPRAGEMFNQVKNYNDMVGIVKDIEDAKNATTDYANEVAGNMEMAKNLDGLSPQAAFANKNLLTAYSMRERDKVKQTIADANNLVKRYGIDKRTAMQLAVQNLINEKDLAVAAMYSGMGYPGVGLNQQGTAVPQVSYPQQVSDPLGDRFKRSIGH